MPMPIPTNRLRYLIMYMILSLLFAVSVKLHVHAGETAAYASHGGTVAISTPDHLGSVHHQLLGEIEVSLDKFPKSSGKILVDAALNHTTLLVMPAVFYGSAAYQEITHRISRLPFAGTPPLRAPPL